METAKEEVTTTVEGGSSSVPTPPNPPSQSKSKSTLPRFLDTLLGKRRAGADTDVDVDTPHGNGTWKVVRLAAKSSEQRKQEGGNFKSPQRKVSCRTLTVLGDGVVGTATATATATATSTSTSTFTSIFSSTSQTTTTTTTIRDYNNYRTQGHSGRFEARTRDRAVSVATVAAYDKFRRALASGSSSTSTSTSSTATVQDGDFGENVLIDGPPALAGPEGLFVGARLRIGTKTVLELTEANNPCYRFNATSSWAPAAKALWGPTAPSSPAQWYHSPECPLNHTLYPGVRGWLARVLDEGVVTVGDTVTVVRTEPDDHHHHKEGTHNPTTTDDSEDGGSPSPAKKLKTTLPYP